MESGFRIRVSSRFRGWGLGIEDWESGVRDRNWPVLVSGSSSPPHRYETWFRVQGSGSRFQGPGSRVQGSGSKVQRSRIGVWGSGKSINQRFGFRVED